MSKSLDGIKDLVIEGNFLKGERKLFCNWLIAELDFDCGDCINNIDNDCNDCDALNGVNETVEEQKEIIKELRETNVRLEKKSKSIF